MNIHEWLEYGRTRGWCSEVTCDTHQGIPFTDAEIDAMEEGDDRCCYVVRLYEEEGEA